MRTITQDTKSVKITLLRNHDLGLTPRFRLNTSPPDEDVVKIGSKTQSHQTLSLHQDRRELCLRNSRPRIMRRSCTPSGRVKRSPTVMIPKDPVPHASDPP